MPTWFKALYGIQFTLNMVFLIVALLILLKIGEFWMVDSRNMWVEIKNIRATVEREHGKAVGDQERMDR